MDSEDYVDFVLAKDMLTLFTEAQQRAPI